MKTNLAMVKKGIFLVLFAVMLALSFALTACNSKTEYAIEIESTAFELEKGESMALDFTLTKDGKEDASLEAVVTVSGDSVVWSDETGTLSAVQAGTSTVTVAIKGHESVKKNITVNVPQYTITFTNTEVAMSEGETVSIAYAVKKNGATVSDKKVTFTVEGDAITVNSLKKQVTAVQAGSAILIATLEGDETVTARATYTVKGVFFSRDDQLKRGTLDFTKEDEGVVEILGGQATVLCKSDDTKFVFKTTLEIKSDVGTSESFGVGSFRDNGDNALWFGLRGTNTNGTYNVYIKNFLDGWASPKYDGYVANYSNYAFGTTIEFVIVRDGDDYWYSIGGLCGTFHDDFGTFTDEPMFAGIYSQEKIVTVTDFSVSYEQDVVDAAKEEYGVTVSKLAINEKNVNLLEKGAHFTYTATAYSAGTTPSIVWEIDKTEMTAGADETYFSNGALELSNDAAGYITIKVNCGGKEDSLRIEISSETLTKSTDTVTVSGGVGLDLDTSKVTFSEERNFNNETLTLNKYMEIPYMAKLNSTVIGDFTLEFKVKNYISESDAPVLLVSLGGEGNNFAITSGNVKAYTYRIGENNDYQYGEQNGSAFASSFDPTAEHAYKIVVSEGKYSVYVDDTLVEFTYQPIRRVEDYITECNVMFTTNAGTSCEVYDFVITAEETDIVYYQVNNNSTLTDDGFMLNFMTNGWLGKDYSTTRLYYLEALPEVFHLEITVQFSAAMNDSKFVLQIGSWEFQVNNVNGTLQGQLYGGGWDNAPKTATTYSATAETKIIVERVNGYANFYIGDTLISSLYNVPSDTLLSFYTFNENTDDVNATVTASNLTVAETFVTLTGASQVKAGETATYTATVYGGGEVEWSVDTANLTAGTATIDGGVLSPDIDAEGTVTVKATVGTYTASYTVTIIAADKTVYAVSSENLTFSDLTETGFTLAAGSDTEWDRAEADSAVYKDITSSANWIMTFNLSLSAEMTDSKLCIRFGGGSNYFTVCFGNGSYKVEVRNVWGGTGATDWDIKNIAVKIVCIDGAATLYINDNYVCNNTVAAAAGSRIDFFVFNGQSGEAGTLFTLSDITVIDTFVTLTGASQVKAGETATYTATVYGGGEVEWSVDTANLTAGTATIDGGTLSPDANAEGTVTVKATVGTYTASYTVTIIAADKTIYAVSSDNLTLKNVTENGFAFAAGTNDMWEKDWDRAEADSAVYKDVTTSANWTMTFNLSLSAEMTDSKLCIRFGDGGNYFTICFGNGNYKAEVRNLWGGTGATDWNITNIAVKIVCTDGVATLYINDNYVCNNTVAAATGSRIDFFVYNEQSSEADTIFTVSNLELTDKN